MFIFSTSSCCVLIQLYTIEVVDWIKHRFSRYSTTQTTPTTATRKTRLDRWLIGRVIWFTDVWIGVERGRQRILHPIFTLMLEIQQYINIRPAWSKSRSQRRCSGPRRSHISACRSAALHRPALPAAATAALSGSCCLRSPLGCPPIWTPPPPHFSWVAPCSTSSRLPCPPWSTPRRRRSTVQHEEPWIYLEQIAVF